MTAGWIRCRVGTFALETAWEVEAGQVLVLFGPSGAGKTLTLRAIAGLVEPAAGHIEIGGVTVFDREEDIGVPSHRRGVGYVPQQYHLFPHLTVADNIGYGLRGRPRKDAQARLGELMATFRLDGLERRRAWELSSGQQQRVALARALAPRPRLLLLDEPFSALDTELRRALRRELRSTLRVRDIPIILVTHDREEALALGDRVQVLDNGQVLGQGEPLALLGQPPQARLARLVGVENMISTTVMERLPQDGTMVCTAGGVRLEVPLADVEEGERVTVGLRASDVILARERPEGLSARNVLPGTVVVVDTRNPGYDVTVECGPGPAFLLHCQVTRRALEELDLRAGRRVWAVVKASSCFLVAQDATLAPPAQAP